MVNITTTFPIDERLILMIKDDQEICLRLKKKLVCIAKLPKKGGAAQP